MKRSKHLCFLLVLYVLVVHSLAEDFTLNINFDKPIFVTDDKFLSLTVDPAILLAGSALSGDFEKSVNLAKAMAPAYIRLGGPSSTYFRFTNSTGQDNKDKITVLSESDWNLIHRWAKKTKLNVISCIRPDDQRDKINDTEDTMEIISFSDHMAFNGSWQLGYECQTGCNIPAGDLARQTLNLRKILNEFPRYTNSLVTGPDVVDYRNEKQRQYLKDYFDIAAPVLSAITWHPDFASITLDDEGAFIHQDDLEKDKEELLKVIGPFIDKQPLWIAESKPEEYKNLYVGALILARRLGNAAKSKINVLMRQPTDITQPSPDYWVSLLHKTLVGTKVFDANVQTGDKNHIHLFCQCTKPSNMYDKGSVTIFGVNLDPEEAVIKLKGIRSNMVHEYVLSPGFDAPNRMFSESVLLNNRTLDLINDRVPEFYPVILIDPEGLQLELQPGGIGFWVLPDLKVKACMEDDGTPEADASSSFNVFEDSGSVEDIKIQIVRSVQDRSTTETEKREKTASPITRKSILQRELRKLRKFTKKRLDEYDTAKNPSKPNDSSTSEPEDAGDKPESQQESENKLQEFKNRILRIRSTPALDKMKPRINNIITRVTSLLSRVQNTLQSMRPEADQSNKMVSSSNVRNNFKTLYDFLNRVNLNEPVNRIVKGERPRLFKRDLYDTIEKPMNRKWKNPPRKRFEGDDLRIAENVGQIVRPRVVEWENSDSDEHTFYGFFKMDPAEGFPEGDVFLTAEDLPEAKNSRTAGQQTDVRFSGSDYVNPKDLLTEDEDDYSFYGPSESFANSRRLNDKDRVGSKSFAELWEAEAFEPHKNLQLGDEYNLKRIPKTQDMIDFQGYDRFIDGQSSNRKTNYEKRQSFDRRIDQKPRMSDDNRSPIFKSLDFSMGSDYDDYGRFKRDVKDLHTILDQEMIKEDDANSKDCNCRVIRSPRTCNCRTKRSTTESTESATVSEVESLNSHDMADVEVFAELKDEPLEAVQSRTESSNLKVGQNRPGSTSVKKILGSATPPVVSSSSLGSNKNDRGEGGSSFDEKSRKGGKQVANLDLEAVPSERIEVTSANLGDFNSEMDFTVTSSSLSVTEDDRSLETPIQSEGDTFSRVESRDVEGEIANSDLEAIPSEMIGVTSENFGNFDTETPILIPSMVLTSNEDGQSSEMSIEREIITSFHEKSQQNEDQIANTDLERIPSETVSAASMNLENFNSEASTLATSLTLAPDEEGQSSEMPNQRDKSTFNDQESGKNEGESSTSDLEIIPVGAASINLENYNSETPISASSLTLTPNEDVESTRSSRMPIRRQGSKFFLKKSRQNEAEKSTVAAPQDSTRYNSSNWEFSTPSTSVEAVQEEAEEDSSTTFKSATLWEQDIAEESEMESEVDQTAVASSKRQVVDGQIPKLSETTAADSLSKDSRRIGKQRQNLSSKKTKSNIAKARELQLMRRARVLSALTKMIRGKTGDAVYKFRSRPISKDRVGERLKNSEEQESKNEKSRERRKIMFQKFQKSFADEMDEMDEMNDEERNLKRREVWEMIDDTDDLEDVMDCEKLACVLVYKPTKNDNNESHESIEKRDAPETEVVRSRNVRERVFNPKNQRNYHDSIMEHSDPHGVRTEIVELKDLYDSETSRIDEDDGDDDKTYFALVENLDKPRIFRLREKGQDEEISVQISSYSDFSDDFYGDQPRNRAYRTNFKNPNGKEIYIIDPSEYRGGEPILKPYKGVEAISRPSKSRSNLKSKTVHEAIRKILRRPQKIHKTEHKREDKSKISTEHEELSENVNTGELLKVLIDNLDLQSVEQLFRQLEKYNTIEEKHNYIRSIVEDMKKERSEEDVDRAGFESMENSKENESVEIIDLTETMDTGSNEDDTNLEVSLVQEYSGEEARARRRRDTINESKDDYSKWLKSSFLHKTLSKVQNTEQGNDLLLKEDSENNFNEGSSKILEVLKENKVVKNKQSNLDDLSSVHMDEFSSNTLDKSEMLKMFPWAKKFGRFRRQAVEKEGKINGNTDMVKPSEVLQRLEESSSPKIQPLAAIDDIEKSLIEKKPIERYAKTENQKKDNVHGLPSFIQQSIPSLQNVVIDGLQKAENFTGSVERLIENLDDENSNETTNNEKEKNWIDSKSIATTHVFHNAIINVKKFFSLLGGITRILRG